MTIYRFSGTSCNKPSFLIWYKFICDIQKSFDTNAFSVESSFSGPKELENFLKMVCTCI